MKLRDYQEAAVCSIFEYFANGGVGNPIVAMPTGCHAKGQGILMYDGSVRAVESIKVGNLLMGPDSKPRQVLNLYHGRQEMRKIIPNNGTPWVVNKDHLLALRKSQERNGTNCLCHSASYVVETVAEYEATSKWHKHIHKLYRVAVEFPGSENLEVDPYFLGLFLGDGSYTQSQVQICSMDEEILDFCKTYFGSLGDLWRISDNGSLAYSIHATTKIRNPTRRTVIARKLDDLGLRGKGSATKFIPQQYKTASRQDRLKLLAGLVDTDGHNNCGGFEYCTISNQLAEDVVFLARSLGFACSMRKNLNEHAGYFRIFISGDCTEVPTKLERKKAIPREQKKNVLYTGFEIEQLPEDDFYGFELDGDHLYLLNDFTVTHNTGKSIVLGEFIKRALQTYPGTRVMKLTHVRELIEQNADKLRRLWPEAPLGIYSAGLKRKDQGCPITFGGVASVAKASPSIFGRIDLLLIDECHLVSQKETTMYRVIIDVLRSINPSLKVIGFTATHYRLGHGMLTESGGIFTDICFDLTRMDAFNWFIEQGYLATLIPRTTAAEFDLSEVHIHGGEYKQDELQAAVDKSEITYAACQELRQWGHDREHWLLFASGIEHAEHVTSCLQSMGIAATFVHSKMSADLRDSRIAEFVSGKYRAMINNGILTTGFDFPGIDLIGMLRATLSPGLWVQMLGRGTRPVYASGFDLSTVEGRHAAIKNGPKQNCLVLDFAGNTRRLGPINDPVLPRKKGKGKGQAPVKVCEICGTYNHASVRVCVGCATEFPKHLKISEQAGTDELIATQEIKTEIFKVDRVTYSKHHKQDFPDSIQVNYYCGLRMFKEWVCLEHNGFASKKARDWWRERSVGYPPPDTTAEAMELIDSLKEPIHIRVWLKSKYDDILGYDFTGNGFGEEK